MALLPLAGSLVLAACGGGSDGSQTLQQSAPNEPVVPQSFDGLEDSPLQGVLSTKDLPAGNYKFEIVSAPGHGTVSVNAATGEFNYVPDQDFFGVDGFDYRITRTVKRPVRGRVVVNLSNVNDAPVLAAIGDMMNSPETRDTTYAVPAIDVDGDALQVSVTSADSSVATVSANSSERTILIAPGVRGTSKIHVTVTDGVLSSEQEFDFTVGDVTKVRQVAADMAAGEAITFTNTADASITLTFEHNGFPLFLSDQQVVEYIADQPEQYPGESMPRKIWRFVRDSTYHNVPLNADEWLHDAWAVLSQGWGFCSHVAATYVHLARAAGYEARVWGLFGHVVPEAKVGDEWQMFDPDLSVYYFKPDGRIAGVEDIANDPSLVTSPVNPMLDYGMGLQYSQAIADYYSSTVNNFIDVQFFVATEPGQYQPLVLPPGSRFTYPGKWSPEVLGVDGTAPYSIPYYLQGQLLTPSGWTGTVVLPWMLWEIRGTGRVRVRDEEYDIGSPELLSLLRNPGGQIPSVEVLSSTSDLRFVLFINAMRYGLQDMNDVLLTGKDVWGVQVGTRLLSEDARPDATGSTVFKKPVP